MLQTSDNAAHSGMKAQWHWQGDVALEREGVGDIIVINWKPGEFGPKLEPTYNLQTPLFGFHTFKIDSVSIKSYKLSDSVPTAENKLANTQDCGGDFISKPQIPPNPS